MARRTFHTDTPLQSLLVEQALLLARQLEATANDAPDGQVLSAVEATAVPAARELARKAVEATLQQQAPAVEKRATQPRLPAVRATLTKQGTSQPQCPDRRRDRASEPPVSHVPGVSRLPLPARREAWGRRVRQPTGPTPVVLGRCQLVIRPGQLQPQGVLWTLGLRQHDPRCLSRAWWHHA